MNEYDSNRILDLVKKIHYIPTKNINEADCYVLNTCHIREKATEKVYHDVGRIKKHLEREIKTNCFNHWLRRTSRRGDITKKRKIY
jgi:tRNA-2-methylthio-N6-dimethylallyladenosine synthase